MTREEMILDNMGLVHMVVKRFLGRGCDREDLVQIGSVGLVNAVDRYDDKMGYSFSTYAVPMIMGEIQRFLRDNSMVHISRKIKTDARKIANVREYIEKTENRKAKIDELMVLCDLTKDEIIMAMEAMQPLKTEQELQNHVSRDSDKIDLMIDEMTVKKLLDNLCETDRKIITMRYMEERTQSEIGRSVGMTQVAVSRREKKLLALMKQQIK